ncbi:hypothetical protein OPQ81_006212 [Rhizoctonia solani]|nr:hypothetical protein OPQ81_006212 [Rhizoctonia solani]
MLKARIEDQERRKKILSLKELKKIPKLKTRVDFLIHQGDGNHELSPPRVIDNKTVIVLKGVDGILYHAQQVVEQLFQSNARLLPGQCKVHSVDLQSGARDFARGEDRRIPGKGWLVEISSALLVEQPTFDNRAKPKIQYRKGPIRPLLPGSSSSTGVPTTDSSRTTPLGTRGTGVSDATARVKEMVAQLEKKEAENKGKEKKGFFGKLLGGKK